MARAVGNGRRPSAGDQGGLTARAARRRRDVGIAVVVLVIVAAAVLPPAPRGPPRPARGRALGDDLRRDRRAGDAVPRPRHQHQRGHRGVRPAGFLPRFLPDRPALAVPVAAVAGAALPGCECGSVPIAGRLVSRGVPPAAASTFLLSAPAINPVVLVATAVAFPGRPRSSPPACSPACSLRPSSAWSGRGWPRQPAGPGPPVAQPRGPRSGLRREPRSTTCCRPAASCHRAATAATLQTVVPRSVLDNRRNGTRYDRT